MDFDIEEVLQELLKNNQIKDGIELVEKEIREKYNDTNFTKILGLDLLQQVDELETYLEMFIGELQERISLKAIYATINGFSINYDLWYVDFFGFDFIGEMDDSDWLADYDDENEASNPFVIKGFEVIQKVYQTHHENKHWEEEHFEDAADTCDYLVILRLQELFNKVIEQGKTKGKRWTEISIFVAAHDYELVYRNH
jgi:hypothetical protein